MSKSTAWKSSRKEYLNLLPWMTLTHSLTMFRYLVNQSVFDDTHHRVYSLNGVVLQCSCHKDMAINPAATWMCKFIKNEESTTMFMTMDEAESKFHSLCEAAGLEG